MTNLEKQTYKVVFKSVDFDDVNYYVKTLDPTYVMMTHKLASKFGVATSEILEKYANDPAHILVDYTDKDDINEILEIINNDL